MSNAIDRAMADAGWQTSATAPEGVLVMTCIADEVGSRNEQTLVRYGNLWFVDEQRSMYVYYRPTYWRFVQ